MKKLIEFVVIMEPCRESKSRFVVSGDYVIATDHDGNPYPEFSNIKAEIFRDGNYEDYSPKGCSWAGHRFTAEDIIMDVLACICRGGSSYQILYLDGDLEALIVKYQEEMVPIEESLKLPKRILGKDGDVYELLNVTEQYIYYTHDDHTIMLSLRTREVISDNYFAEVGWNNSMEAVINGKERMLYGELPEDFA